MSRGRDVFRIKSGNFVFVLPDIETERPIPILVLDDRGRDVKFHSLVLDVGKIHAG